MKKLFVSDNYIIFEEGAAHKGEYSTSKSIYKETDDHFIIEEEIDRSVLKIAKADVDASQWEDDVATAYTQSTLRTFLRQNTGFKPATEASVNAVANDLSTHESDKSSPHKDRVTTAQRLVRVAVNGETVHDTDLEEDLTYNSTYDLWLNDSLRPMKCGIAGMVVGAPVKQKNVVDECETSTTLKHIAVFGFIFEGDLSLGGWVSVRTAKKVKALMNGTVNINELVYNDVIANECYSNASGGTGAVGITNGSRSGAGSSLVEIWVHKMDTF